jgi:pimeloyl-ACP methyl ester carboxylesterase
MKTVDVNDVTLEYELIGQGQPLLLIHGSNIATGLSPLAAALAGQAPSLQLVRYHRRGMAGSTGGQGPISVEQQAADAVGLLDALGIPSAHVLGYSYGGVVALELALAAPARMQSLVLLEPVLTEVPSAHEFNSAMEPIMSRYATGDMAGALTTTFSSLGGTGWRDLIATAGPDALAQAILDSEIFYRAEWPSLKTWTFDAQRASAVRAPVLSVLGTASGPFFAEGRQLLHQRFPQCTDVDIPDVNHLLYLQAPGRIADAVADFLGHH